MVDLYKITKTCILLLFLSGCNQVLELVEIGDISDEQLINADDQKDFDIKLKSLSLIAANNANLEPYPRYVMVNGVGDIANLYSEASLMNSKVPPLSENKEYVLGIADELTFMQLQNYGSSIDSLSVALGENNAVDAVQTPKESLIKAKGSIGSDGSILLIGVGRLDAAGKTINELRNQVRNILIRKGLTPNFQLEITDFLSRKAFVFGSFASDKAGVVPITEKPLSLKELVAMYRYATVPDHLNIVTLTRNNINYVFNESDLLNEITQKIVVKDKDQIRINNYEYKSGQVYVLSGGTSAEIVSISPQRRQNMADVLFLNNGILSNTLSKRSEVYLLRGQNPVTAYHLDAQNASKILVAKAMELRPSDIIYVAQRPIISFARLLNELSPLRILLRDIQDGEVP